MKFGCVVWVVGVIGGRHGPLNCDIGVNALLGNEEMVVVVFDSHMFVTCFGVVMFECFGYSGKCWCHMFLGCFSYGRMCWRNIFVGCFDYNHVVIGGMGYALVFVVRCVTCIGCGFCVCGLVILLGRKLCVSGLVILLGIRC